MRHRIDRSSAVPLYEQIANAVRWMVATGEIARGTELEPTREAATSWGVNRHTVRQAYQRLVQWGLAESRPPHRFVVVANVSSSREQRHDKALDAFLSEVLESGERRFGLDPEHLVAALHERVAAPLAGTVVVVECNSIQVQDHSDQIAERWAVRPIPFVLGRSRQLPPGPVVCTAFHFDEVRAAWPDRLHEMRFMAVRADPELRTLVAGFLPQAGTRSRIVILAGDTQAEARNLSADLQELFPSDQFDHDLEIRKHWQLRDDDTPTLTLAAPRAWDAMHALERELPHVFCVRYRIDDTDLESLGTHFGWKPR